MLRWLLENKQWVFSGIGVAIITWIATLVVRRKSSGTQSQHSGANSTNIQSAGDINISGETKRKFHGKR